MIVSFLVVQLKILFLKTCYVLWLIRVILQTNKFSTHNETSGLCKWLEG